MARQLARRILAEELDPLDYTRDFELLWIRANYSAAIQDAGLLDDQKATAEYIGQTKAELRNYATDILRALITPGEPGVEILC
ncbi:hypothetical protein ACFPT7_00180 [Acidicapsa dinghuensis]|uniref:Uncharacterized protein n=1 Tax=Acidicapsa dinghuensis TaxID=2218256 RepID=A0ABW1E8Z4_9BACT|nr:hypothetical protein [Acidicapsa dinghuensis]